VEARVMIALQQQHGAAAPREESCGRAARGTSTDNERVAFDHARIVAGSVCSRI